MATQRRTARGEVNERLRDLVLRGYSASQIHRTLLEQFGEAHVPTLRTVQRTVRDLKTEDLTEQWSLGTSSGEEARMVLGVLADLLVETDGRIHTITKREAEWIVRISGAVPGLPGWTVWSFVKEYMMRDATGDRTEDLDTSLALAPRIGDSEDAVRQKALLQARLLGRWQRSGGLWVWGAETTAALLEGMAQSTEDSELRKQLQTTAVTLRKLHSELSTQKGTSSARSRSKAR
jgi:hypothetical protein